MVSDECYVSKMLNRLHLHERVEQICTGAYGAVVFLEIGVLLL